MVKKRVLVVEDEDALALIVLNMLEVFGWEGTIAKTAAMALQLLEHEEYQKILIDLSLPDLPGIDLYHKICDAHPRFRGQVVFTSGFELPEEVEEVIQNEGGSFLSKPFSVERFRSVVDSWE